MKIRRLPYVTDETLKLNAGFGDTTRAEHPLHRSHKKRGPVSSTLCRVAVVGKFVMKQRRNDEIDSVGRDSRLDRA